MKITQQIALGIALLVCCTVFSYVEAAQIKTNKPNTNASYYKCKDAKGQTYTGSSMPVECQGRDTDIINMRGIVISTIEGEGTRSTRLEREAAEAAEQKMREERYQRDKVLIETYLSVDEIERLRDQRLDLLTAQLRVAEQHINTLRDRLVRLQEQSARFRPYSAKPNAQALPDHLAEDLVGTVKSIAVDEETIEIKRIEQATMTANFDRDISRFKELKGLK